MHGICFCNGLPPAIWWNAAEVVAFPSPRVYRKNGHVMGGGAIASSDSCADEGARKVQPAVVVERLWQKFFSDPSQWWDNRLSKNGPRSPDFTHKASKEVLWVDGRYKPPWVDSQLATLGSQSRPPARVQGEWKDDHGLQNLCRDGQLGLALDAMHQMDRDGRVPSVETYFQLMRACRKNKALTEAKQVLANMVKNGMDCHKFLSEHLVNTLVQCGSLVDGLQVFRRLSQQVGVHPNSFTFVNLLKACSSLPDLEQARWIHGEILRHGYGSDTYIGSTLVHLYAKCGSMVDAYDVFRTLPKCNVVLWNALIAGYAQKDQPSKALELYGQMRKEGVKPSHRTFVSVLQACAILGELEAETLLDGMSTRMQSLDRGMAIHSDAARSGYGSDVFVGNTLVSMYAKCGSIESALHVFNTIPERGLVSWNAMISGFTQHRQEEKALHLFAQMQEEGTRPDVWTFATVLKACTSLADMEDSVLVGSGKFVKVKSLEKGKAIHAEAIQNGYASDVFVGSALVSMYAKCGSIDEAMEIFDTSLKSDVVSWNAMLGGYVEQEQGEKAIRLYAKMQEYGVRPDEASFVWVLKACSNIGALTMCSQVHQDVESTGYACSLDVLTALIHAYGKCGSMARAQTVFDGLPRVDVVAWTALIAGYARQGDFESSVLCFEQMERAGFKATGVTFLSLLSACSHAGKVEQGLRYFESMRKDYGINATTEHFVCMIDLLGRAGLFSKVEDLLLEMPMQPNWAVWSALLGACRKHSNVVLGRQAFDCLVHLQPNQASPYVVMSHIYADVDMWSSAEEIEDLRWKAGATLKKPGYSWIEHEKGLSMFMVGDCTRQQTEEVYKMLEAINGQLLKERGHIHGKT